MVHFGLKRSILVHLGPPTVLWPRSFFFCLSEIDFRICDRNLGFKAFSNAVRVGRVRTPEPKHKLEARIEIRNLGTTRILKKTLSE